MSDSSLPSSRAKWRLLPKALPGLLIAAALAMLFAHEAWSAFSEPAPYEFGSESMLAKGGREHASVTSYVLAAALSTALSLLSMGVLLRGAFLGNARFMGVGYLCLLAAPMVGKLL